MRSFAVVIERCQETGLYVGSVPGLPGAHSQGETLEELHENIREVISMLLEETVTNQERELASLGMEYAEGIEQYPVVVIPSTGREVRKIGEGRWEVQPWNDNYWKEFNSIVEAVRFGTRPKPEKDRG